MTIELTAFKTVPDFAKGFVKDLRVRWALEEAGISYTERLIDHEEKMTPAHRRRQPFAQVPVYKDDNVELFESGAILLYLARTSEALAPSDPAGQARATSWVCAALNSIEPYVADVLMTQLFYPDEPWADGFEKTALKHLDGRLAYLSDWLGDREWLEDRFTVGDIMMVTVLRNLIDRGPSDRFPALDAYRRRGEARPAFERALAAQLQAFEKHEAS